MVGLGVEMTNVLAQYFTVTPTLPQYRAFEALVNFLTAVEKNSCFVLKGYAGTGKTTLLAALVKALPTFRMRSVLLAPTGRAAKVMSAYAGIPATTIHKKIYRKRVAGTQIYHLL